MGTSAAAPTTARRYLMCPPTFFAVRYEINPWMDRGRPVDRSLARRQWERLRSTLADLGHDVRTIEPVRGLPDMVFAANGASVRDGVVLSAVFRHAERAPEGPVYLKWFADQGYVTHMARNVNEGQGDFLSAGEVVLAGWGARTARAAHAEAADLWGVEVVSLELVDPRYFHLDTALTVLRGGPAAPGRPAAAPGGAPGVAPAPAEIAYFPPAFSAEARATLADRFPDAIRASEADAGAFGLNAVSDGRHVILPPDAPRLAAELRERGYEPILVDTSELLHAGGGAKCATLEIGAPPS